MKNFEKINKMLRRGILDLLCKLLKVFCDIAYDVRTNKNMRTMADFKTGIKYNFGDKIWNDNMNNFGIVLKERLG